MATLTVKLIIDSSTKRVLFAEAGKDTVDFLFSLLSKPIHEAINLLATRDSAACFGNVLQAAKTLNPACLTPLSSTTTFQAAPVCTHQLYRCNHLDCRGSDRVTKVAGMVCPCCKGKAVTPLYFLETCFYHLPRGCSKVDPETGGGGQTFFRCPSTTWPWITTCPRSRVTDMHGMVCPYCKDRTIIPVQCMENSYWKQPEAGGTSGVTPGRYAIMDDLSVKAMSAASSSIALLSALGVTSLATLNEMTVQLGDKEGLRMLWVSLQSKTVLTDVFLRATDVLPLPEMEIAPRLLQ